MKVKGLDFTKSQSDIKELKDESYVTYSFDNILVNNNLELTFSKPLENYISTRIMILIIFLIFIKKFSEISLLLLCFQNP